MSKLNLKDTLKSGLGAAGLKAEPPIRRDSPLEPSSPRTTARAEVLIHNIPKQAVESQPGPMTVKQSMILGIAEYEALRNLAAKLQHNGHKHPERITSNTVLRCFLSLVEHFKGDPSKVKTEEDLRRLVHDQFLK